MQANIQPYYLFRPVMLFFYFAILWFSSLLLVDSGSITLFDIGTKVYFIDLFFIYFFVCFIFISVKTKFKYYQLNRLFLFFLLVLLASLCYGLTRYGFSSIGEGRYVYWLMMFAVPLYFYSAGEIQSLRDFDKFFKITFCLVILNVLLLLVIELINGGRFFLTSANKEFANLTDSRGTRYLGSEESFHLGVVLVYLVIDQFVTRKKSWAKLLLMLFLLAVILFTKNRTALLSLALGLITAFLLEGRGKLIAKLGLSIVIITGLSFLLFPSFIESVLTPIIGVFHIYEDQTGNWRLLVQAVAIEQSLKTPIFGQGFGGYFEYYSEALGGVINYPPHSMYVYLFQKTGVIGLLGYVFASLALIRECTTLRQKTFTNKISEKYRLLIKVVLISEMFYSLAYDISIYAGLFIGMLVVLRKITSQLSPNTVLA